MKMRFHFAATGALRLSIALLFLAALLASASCRDGSPGGPASRAADRLVITGSSTIAPLMAEIALAYEAAHPGVRIDVQAGGSSRGIADVRRGLADIGMVSRAPKPGESGLRAAVIARDGIAIVVHRDNPLAELSRDRIIAIYRGEITNWSQAGGADAPITVVNKAEGRSTLELFLAHFALDSSDVKASVVIGDNEQGIKTVAGNPDAIGYVSIGAAEVSIQNGVPIRLLPLGGVAATRENVRNGTFPLARDLTLVTLDEPAGLARDLIDFALSKAAMPLVEDLAFVPLDG